MFGTGDSTTHPANSIIEKDRVGVREGLKLAERDSACGETRTGNVCYLK